ncbi:MAG: cytochrome C [Aliarcobacter sp.]|nr:cytochrome C [Aliarcobacter sp.]
MKLLKVIMAGSLMLGLASSSLSADAVKGQKLFSKLLKGPCDMNGAKFAAKHSQEEWKELKTSGKFEAEVIKICPNVKAGDLSDSVQEHIIDFVIEFANDSGNVPSC